MILGVLDLYIVMKALPGILLVLFVILILFQSFMAYSTTNIEKQKYTLIRKEKEFEIRYYPPATMATIRSTARSYRELSGSGFRSIAGYIFGNNETSQKIAMTSPVHMDIQENESSMSFVMPAEYGPSTLPRPNDARVVIHESPAEYVAAISFGGYAGDDSIKRYTDKLRSALEEKGIKPTGHFRYLGYNPPYQVVGRKNEIIVAVEWKQ